MLTQLRIRNFKAWQDTGNIRLAPLTVFFGTNSSGKTSLLQFLLMLKQTVQSPDRRRVLHFGDKHSLVNLEYGQKWSSGMMRAGCSGSG
ncbi:AAA family ATPase [Cystobacter fuscus]